MKRVPPASENKRFAKTQRESLADIKDVSVVASVSDLLQYDCADHLDLEFAMEARLGAAGIPVVPIEERFQHWNGLLLELSLEGLVRRDALVIHAVLDANELVQGEATQKHYLASAWTQSIMAILDLDVESVEGGYEIVDAQVEEVFEVCDSLVEMFCNDFLYHRPMKPMGP